MSEMFKDQNMQKSIREIGSEFWIEGIPDKLIAEREGVYAISGRTAIDLILQDLLKKRPAKRVYMPAWCCDSMLAPFLDWGFEVKFYDINLDDSLRYTIDEKGNSDVFYLTNYFGYENTLAIETVKQFKAKGAIILYDRTHSFLMNDAKYREIADYSFASIRKWMGVVGGAVIDGLLDNPDLKDCPYAPIKEVAMQEKFRYLRGDKQIVKENFLNAFGEFGHRLAQDYKYYEMDNLSYSLYKQADLKEMGEQRRANAGYLHNHLHSVTFIGNLTDNAAPLFVPVFLENKAKRDTIRKKLTRNNIYCPIHWPKPQLIPEEFAVNKIYDTELSLICDQRYGLNEIKQIVNIIQSE